MTNRELLILFIDSCMFLKGTKGEKVYGLIVWTLYLVIVFAVKRMIELW